VVSTQRVFYTANSEFRSQFGGLSCTKNQKLIYQEQQSAALFSLKNNKKELWDLERLNADKPHLKGTMSNTDTPDAYYTHLPSMSQVHLVLYL